MAACHRQVRRIHTIFRKALNDALRWGLVERNVATLADPPPARLVQAARRRSMRTWGYDELRTFLRQTEGHALHMLWVVAATTGMRRSELLGLRWDDADLVRSTVTVRRTVVPGLDGYELMDAQKSTTSARTIHLDGHTVAMLRRHRERQQALGPRPSQSQTTSRTTAGAGAEAEPISNNQSLVFTRVDGSCWNPSADSLAFRRAVKAAGVRSIRFHDLRHTHATLLLKAGVNPKVVQNGSVTARRPSPSAPTPHVMPGMQSEAAELFCDLVFSNRGSDDDEGGEIA